MVLFLGLRKKFGEKSVTLKSTKRDIKWPWFQSHITFEWGVMSVSSLLSTVHLNGDEIWSFSMFAIPKLKELQWCKVRL